MRVRALVRDDLVVGLVMIIGFIGTVASISTTDGKLRVALGAAAGLPTLLLFLIFVGAALRKAQVFEARSDLPAVKKEVAGVRKLRLWFLTGEVLTSQGDLQAASGSGVSVQLMLIPPYSKTLEAFVAVAHGQHTVTSLSERIARATEHAKRTGWEVKWYDGPPPGTLWLADPDSEDAWTRIEWFLPAQAPTTRPSVKFTRRDFPVAFATLVTTFESAWSAATVPDEATLKRCLAAATYP